jgi:hypothetical protein
MQNKKINSRRIKMEENKFYISITYMDPATFGAMDFFENVTKAILISNDEFLCIIWDRHNIAEDTYVSTKTVIPMSIIAKIETDGDIQISNYF